MQLLILFFKSCIYNLNSRNVKNEVANVSLIPSLKNKKVKRVRMSQHPLTFSPDLCFIYFVIAA